MIGDPRRRRRRSDPALLLRRLERPADAGHQRRAAVPRVRHVAARAHGLRGADRRRATRRSTARWPASPTRTTSHAKLIVLWGVNPSRPASTWCRSSRRPADRGARLVVIDPRATSLARQADLHLAPRPGTDLPLALALHRFLFERGDATGVPRASTPAASTACARAPSAWTIERAARSLRDRSGDAAALRRSLRRRLAGADPLRLGPRAQPQRRQRGGRDPRAAGGRRQVRRARRRLLDEQLRRPGASRRRRG